MADPLDLTRRARALLDALSSHAVYMPTRQADCQSHHCEAEKLKAIQQFGDSCYAEGLAARQGELDAATSALRAAEREIWETYGGDTARIQPLYDQINAVLNPVTLAASALARHEHERGAPLIADCETWCRTKYEGWLRQQPAVPALSEQALMDTAKAVVQGFRAKVAAGEIAELAAVNAAMGITDFIHALLGSATTETR